MIRVKNWCSNFDLKFKNEFLWSHNIFQNGTHLLNRCFKTNEVNIYFSFILFETLLSV